MKRFIQLCAALCALATTASADLTSYDKPRASIMAQQFRLYRQILPQAVPASLTTVVTQASGCTSAAGGAAALMGSGCGVYIDTLVISCPTGSAGTVLVQDMQSSPIQMWPTITTTANTLYYLVLPWYWSPGGFKIQQVTGTGCTFYGSWGVQ